MKGTKGNTQQTNEEDELLCPGKSSRRMHIFLFMVYSHSARHERCIQIAE